jgi:hypothetical protein
MFRASSSIFRRHYTGSFWCELRALVAVGWLPVVGRLVYWASVVPPEDGRLTTEACRGLRHNKVILKVKMY